MTEARPGGFSDVDHQQDTAFFIRVLEAQDVQPGIVHARERALAMLDVRPGMRVLDAGCGLGTAAIELASLVQPGGAVVGMDVSDLMLDQARTRASAAGADIELVHGDITAMSFTDDEFDAARSERVLQHLETPEIAVAELMRVVRPGGRVVVVDTDWDSMTIDLQDVELWSRLRAASLGRFASPTIGRRLYGLFKRAGFADVSVEALPILIFDATFAGTDIKPGDMTVRQAVEDGGITPEEGERVLEEVRKAASEGALLISLVMYAVVGTVPTAS